MYNHCKGNEEIPVQLKISTSEELHALFDNERYVLLAVAQTE